MDYDVVKKYVDRFAREIQEQPPIHNELPACQDVYDKWLKDLPIKGVLELGAGTSPLLSLFPFTNKVGVSLGGEAGTLKADMNTLPMVYDNTWDLVIARHALEHSLMPLIMLCEMARVTKKYALVVVPTCTKEMVNYSNHYSVFTALAWRALFTRAGFKCIKQELEVPLHNEVKENRFLLIK